MFRTRFAPSPTGPLHLGHAFSALRADQAARAAGGEFLLRIDDLDQTRSRPDWEAQIFDDLRWLGLRWPAPLMRQSDRTARYRAALETFWNAGWLYPCTCSRRDISAALSAPQEGADPAHGPDGPVYPGTCRPGARPAGPMPDGVLRLNMRALPLRPLSFSETGDQGVLTITTTPDGYISEIGDVVLARKDMPASYHLSVVLDDADQQISHVVRGADLFEATRIHVLLQHLLDLPQPVYHHHHLIRDAAGKRLAKRDDARAIATYRAEGKSPQDIRKMIGLPQDTRN